MNVKPSGAYVMEDLFHAGGVPAVMKEIEHLLHRDALTVNGHTVGDNFASVRPGNRDVIRAAADPLSAEGGIAVLRGNIAPDGAVIKQSAATQRLLQHRGPALVFETRDEMLARIDSPDLPVDENTVLVMKNCGPAGGPGFPEWGQIPMPKKLLERGISDMLRISDARMSGTSFGTVVLHVAPESAIGGPLAAVHTGDDIHLDFAARRIDVALDAGELERRLATFVKPRPHYTRGYGRLFLDRVTQAHLGCDFDFLAGGE